MERRVGLVTLGVRDLARARALRGARLDHERRARRRRRLLTGGRDDWGGYSGAFTDPDGRAWEVALNPHWTIAEDGSIRL